MSFNCKMHERNIYKTRPDFAQIALDFPLFRKYAIPNAKGKVHVDFSDTEALRMLTKILLKKDFNLDVEIPTGYLIPTIPQRLNYILWVEDLLARIYITKSDTSGIDIGTGPCAIFSLLGAQKNGWKFVATESSDDALCWANKNIERNKLTDKIKVVKVNQGSTLCDILLGNETYFEFCLCNPPFYENAEEIRKKHQKSNETITDITQAGEIFYKGGEVEFVRNIIKDSITFKSRICLFTSMFGKKSSFLQIFKEIKEISDVKVTTTEFCQGNTVRWGIAWTFNESVQFEKIEKKEKLKKKKRPLEYEIPILSTFDKTFFDKLLENAMAILNTLEIPVTVTKSSKNFSELMLMSDKNTWTHQRRKRRELERQKIESSKIVVTNIDFVTSENNTTSISGLNDKNAIDFNVSSENNSKISKSNLTFEKKQDCSTLIMIDEQKMKNNEITAKHHNLIEFNDIPIKSNTEITTKPDLDNTKIIEQLIALPISNNEAIFNNEMLQSKSLEKLAINNEIKHNTPEDNICKMPSIKEKNTLSYSANEEKEFHEIDIEMNEMKFVKNNSLQQSDNSSDSKLSVNKKRKLEFNCEDVSNSEKVNIKKHKAINLNQSCMLHCYLQIIKGRSKIYVKMDCPPSADRNSMYQVFQIIKNKLHLCV